MGDFIERRLATKVKSYLTTFPAVAITGPRQSGKSTLLKHLFKNNYQYITFDRDDMRSMFLNDPKNFMAQYNDRVIFDEVQKIPEIFNYLKIAIDNDRENYGKFIITGSAQFSMIKSITESLAGRIGLLTLLPFESREIPSQEREPALYSGSYPEVVMRHYKNHLDWYASYVDSYLEKDIRGLFNVGDLRDFRRFVSLLAAQASQILNLSGIANDLGIAVSTIKRWVSILEASYIIFLLPPYYNNFGKRIIKSPKIYFYDTGLISYLTGIRDKSLYEQGPMKGAIFENYVIAEIIKKETHLKSMAEFFYYRSSSGNEIDLIIDRKTKQEFIEIKSSMTFTPKMLKPLERLIEPKTTGYLIYSGENLPFKKNIHIINYLDFLK